MIDNSVLNKLFKEHISDVNKFRYGMNRLKQLHGLNELLNR